MNPTSPARIVLDEVATWADITTQPAPRVATAILFDGNELGPCTSRGTPRPSTPRRPTRASARSRTGHGMVLRLGQQATREPADADDGIALLRESYDALRARVLPPQTQPPWVSGELVHPQLANGTPASQTKPPAPFRTFQQSKLANGTSACRTKAALSNLSAIHPEVALLIARE